MLFVVHVIVAVVWVVDEAIEEIIGELFWTVTVMLDVAVLPAASEATAEIVWLPSKTPVEFQVIEYGEVVPDEPVLAPSILNWTPVTPTLSEDVAVRVTLVP